MYRYLKVSTILIIALSLRFSFLTIGQQNDFRVKIGDYGINQLETNGYLCKHYIDSIPSIFKMYLIGGQSEGMTYSQKQLGYFNYLLQDESLYSDNFFLNAYDSLFPYLISSCMEFGFFQFVDILNEINDHRNKNLEIFQQDTTSAIFDKKSDFFDQDLYDLRRKLYRLREDFQFNNIHVEKLRSYIIENKDDLVLY